MKHAACSTRTRMEEWRCVRSLLSQQRTKWILISNTFHLHHFFFVLFEIQMRESKFNLRNKGNRYSHWIFSRLDTNLNYSILQWRRFFSYELCVLPEEKTCAVEVILLDFRSLTFAMQKLFVFRSSALCANLLCKEVVEEMHFSKFLEKQILK